MNEDNEILYNFISPLCHLSFKSGAIHEFFSCIKRKDLYQTCIQGSCDFAKTTFMSVCYLIPSLSALAFKTASSEKNQTFCLTLPFRAHWLKAPWSIFMLHGAMLIYGDVCHCGAFVPSRSNSYSLFSELNWEPCLFCAGTMNTQMKVVSDIKRI